MAASQEYGISYWSIESDGWETLGSRRDQAGRAHDHRHQHAGGRPSGTHRQLVGERVFTVDAPSIGPEHHEPLLILHGFPTSSFDYAAVLDGLRAGRRVLLLDMLGYGLSAKPDRATPWRSRPTWRRPSSPTLGLDRSAPC